jgi:hypothetical protein
MAQPNSLTPPITPFVNIPGGTLTKEGWRFLFSLNKNTSEATAGEVSTLAGSGLEGGGLVADGIDLAIAPNGVTNAMLRNGVATSVIGRFQNSTGDVSDIQATADDRVLVRQSGQLVFSSFLDAISIGPNTAAPLVRCDEFRLDQAPAAGAVVCTHTITISVNGVDYKIPIVAA